MCKVNNYNFKNTSKMILEMGIENNIKKIHIQEGINHNDLWVELSILESAKKYNSGVFERSPIIKSNEAYSIIVNIMYEKNYSDFDECINLINTQLNRLVKKEYEDIDIFLLFLKKIKDVLNKKINAENKYMIYGG